MYLQDQGFDLRVTAGVLHTSGEKSSLCFHGDAVAVITVTSVSQKLSRRYVLQYWRGREGPAAFQD